MKKFRNPFIILFLFLLCFPLFGATYTVVEYKYEGDGKTTDFALDNVCNPHEEEVFYDEESLKDALKSKKQSLWNTNLFSKVSVDYQIISSVDNNNSVCINVTYETASSTFAFPYPKYDSNYGLIFGFRYKEKNLFGIMASMDAALDIQQNQNSFSDADYSFDIPVTGLKVNNFNFSAGLSGDLNLADKNSSFLRFIFNVEEWKIGETTITSSLDANYYLHNTPDSKFVFNFAEKNLLLGPGILDTGFGITLKPENVPFINNVNYYLSYSNLPLGDSKLSISLSNNIYPKPVVPYATSDSLSTLSLNLSNLVIGDWEIADNYSVSLQPSQNEELPARIFKLVNSFTLSIPDSNLHGKKLTGTVLWQLFENTSSSKRLDYLKTITDFSFTTTTSFTNSIILKTWKNRPQENGLDGFDFDLRSEYSFSMFDGKLSISPIITFLNQFSYVGSSIEFTPNLELAVSAQASAGSIDRVSSGESFYAFRDNFRYGTKYSFQMAGRWAGKTNNVDQPEFFFRGMVTSFPFKMNFFNPSFRIVGVISTIAHKWFNRNSSSDPWKIVSAVDEDYSHSYNSYTYGGITFSTGGLNEILRGILLRNPVIEEGGYFSNTVIAGNINLTTAFLNFEDMGHTYLAPFYDFALFIRDNDFYYLHTLGLEAIAVLDSHPAYPVRVSVGFNADNLFDKIHGKDVVLEYEVYIGVGWFF